MNKLTKPTVCRAVAVLLSLSFVLPVWAQYDLSVSDTTLKDTSKYEPVKDLPLKPKRSIRFTTTEGTWTSLDVSPDGKTIVFDMMGDLYTLPVGGGEATQVTKG